MSDMNQVALSGRLTRDPIVRGEGDRLAVTLSIASNRQWPDGAGGFNEEVCFIDVSTFSFVAQRCAGRLKKALSSGSPAASSSTAGKTPRVAKIARPSASWPRTSIRRRSGRTARSIRPRRSNRPHSVLPPRPQRLSAANRMMCLQRPEG